jgi:hypothetical protein
MSEDTKILTEIRDLLRQVVELKQKQLGVQPKQEPKPQPPRALTAADASQAFPEDLRKMLSFSEDGDCVLVKPLGFLGGGNFRKVANIVKGELGGEYVSAGKDSHFRIPKRR